MDASACEEHPAERQQGRLVSQNILAKKATPQMAAGMGHFKLIGDRPTRRPTRKQQLQEAATGGPSKSVLCTTIDETAF